jgi:membrane dipeptidase
MSETRETPAATSNATPNESTGPLIVDAHEDIAWNALTFGRNYALGAQALRRAEAHSDAPQRNGRTLLGLPEWLAGRIAVVFGTLYISPERRRMGVWDLQSYRDAEEAHHRASGQLDYYRRFTDDNEQLELVTTRAGLESVLASWAGADPAARRVGLVPLMEGADPIREPREVEQWYERGVRIVGLAWSGTRYSGGTHEPGPLTALGRELLPRMAEVGMILDTSHLAEEAFFEALERYPGAVIASHSNPRVLAPERRADRHLSDEMIARLAERGGVMGVAPINSWLSRRYERGDPKESVTLEQVVAAIDHVCQVVGDAEHAGLGSDFDGGFGLDAVPAEIDTVADLAKIGPALAARGYGEAQVAAILGGNFLRVLRANLPA